MTDNTDVFLYLEYLKYYFFGDLEEFHTLCKSAEEKERIHIQEKGSIEPVTGSYVHPKEQEFYLSHTYDPTTPRFFRSVIPHALSMFAVVDILGFLLRNTKDYTATTKNFKTFFSGDLSDKEMQVIINLYRHGMSHGYFPKLGLGISYHSANPNTLFYKSNQGIIFFNAIYLEAIVKKKFLRIYYNPLSINPRINEQYESLIISYQSKTKADFEELEKLITA